MRAQRCIFFPSKRRKKLHGEYIKQNCVDEAGCPTRVWITRSEAPGCVLSSPIFRVWYVTTTLTCDDSRKPGGANPVHVSSTTPSRIKKNIACVPLEIQRAHNHGRSSTIFHVTYCKYSRKKWHTNCHSADRQMSNAPLVSWYIRTRKRKKEKKKTQNFVKKSKICTLLTEKKSSTRKSRGFLLLWALVILHTSTTYNQQ